jgi:16S rRNA (cytidine1402-2'-O)-methyltransferase
MSKLFLIPNSINEDVFDLPAGLAKSIAQVNTFFVEEPKSARRLLKQIDPNFPLQQCRYYNLNEHTTAAEINEYLKILEHQDCGIISESGMPCVADPGSELVALAHKHNIKVIPLSGPSSIVMALASSGFSGQNFAFNGYLPKDTAERNNKIKALEQRAKIEGQTQIIMETPYRNQNLLEDLIANCHENTQLCIACDLTGSQQFITTRTVGQWKKMGLVLPKKPALFIISK